MEVSRILLAIGGKFPGQGYTDVRTTIDSLDTYGEDVEKVVAWDSIKDQLDMNLGRPPVVDCEHGSIGQSAAVQFYSASELGLMGSNTYEAAKIIELREHLNELFTVFRKLVPYGTVPTAEAMDLFFDSEVASDLSGGAVRETISDRYLKWYMGRIEAVLPGNGYAVGGKLSLADVLIYSMFADTLSESEARIGVPAHRREPFSSAARTAAALAAHPKIKAIAESVANHENIKKWLSMRGKQGF